VYRVINLGYLLRQDSFLKRTATQSPMRMFNTTDISEREGKCFIQYALHVLINLKILQKFNDDS
jgi:hypothetical protein